MPVMTGPLADLHLFPEDDVVNESTEQQTQDAACLHQPGSQYRCHSQKPPIRFEAALQEDAQRVVMTTALLTPPLVAQMVLVMIAIKTGESSRALSLLSWHRYPCP